MRNTPLPLPAEEWLRVLGDPSRKRVVNTIPARKPSGKGQLV